MPKIVQHIHKICPICDTQFTVPPSLSRLKCCSRACADISQRGERMQKECESCGKMFEAKKDHGVWQRFCGRECFRNQENGPKKATCLYCATAFISYYLKDKKQYRKYCSKECYTNSGRTTNKCEFCGDEFTVQGRHGHYRFCSPECRNEALSGENNHNYKGGRYIGVSGFVFVFDKNMGKWRAEHRVAIEQIIGRLLDYSSEPVLHINGIKHDNSPENLFICDDLSHMQYILQSYDVPYPVKSNLEAKKSPPERADFAIGRDGLDTSGEEEIS